jgi:hypothetical protein
MWPPIAEFSILVHTQPLDADAFREVLDVYHAEIVLGERGCALRELFVGRLADSAQKPQNEVLAVRLNEEHAPVPFARDCVDEEIAESHLNRGMHVDLRLLDQSESSAPF